MEPEGEPRRGLAAPFLKVGAFLAGLPRPVGALLVLSWMGLIWALSEREGHPEPPTLDVLAWIGNLAHAPLFGLLALFALGVVARPRPGSWVRPGPLSLGAVALFVLLWGVIDELHQRSTPGRSSTISDVVTDVVGALSVLWVADFLARAEPGERGLGKRLAVGLAACAASAAWATWG